MIFKTAKAEFKFPINTIYLDGYIGSPEIELEPGETLEDAWDAAYERAKAWVEKKRKQEGMQDDPAPSPAMVKVIQKEASVDNISEVIEDMKKCATLTELREYRLLAGTNPDLQKAYMNKMKSLTQ